jgi:hypothetical protein
VRQPRAREIGLPDLDDLRLRGEPAQRGAVQDPSPVALERAAARTLIRLWNEPFDVLTAIPVLLAVLA